jgi:hypothetical protein
MSVRPSRLWKDLPASTRHALADAFWREVGDDTTDTNAQHIEATLAIARRLNFRPKSIQVLPIERKAKQLAQLSDVSDSIATHALIAYHFTTQRPLMAAFLDALGIANDNGMITAEEVKPPEPEQLRDAIGTLSTFPAEDVSLYLRTLSALDEDTWRHLPDVLAATH